MAGTWKAPPALKVFEALGAVADGRVREAGKGAGTVLSSDRSKTYDVRWNAATNTVSCNDNASVWQGYIGYPAVAYLMRIGELAFDAQLSAAFAGIEWKKLNTRLRDHSKVIAHLRETLHVDFAGAEAFAERIRETIKARGFLRPDRLPPTAKAAHVPGNPA